MKGLLSNLDLGLSNGKGQRLLQRHGSTGRPGGGEGCVVELGTGLRYNGFRSRTRTVITPDAPNSQTNPRVSSPHIGANDECIVRSDIKSDINAVAPLQTPA